MRQLGHDTPSSVENVDEYGISCVFGVAFPEEESAGHFFAALAVAIICGYNDGQKWIERFCFGRMLLPVAVWHVATHLQQEL